MKKKSARDEMHDNVSKGAGPAILIAIGKHVGKIDKKAEEINKSQEEKSESSQFESGEQEGSDEYCSHCKGKLK